MTTIIIALVIIAILLLVIGFITHREYFSTTVEKDVSNTKPTPPIKIIPDPNMISDIPPYNAYVPFESPPDQRYEYVSDLNTYLLPYQYLNFNLPFDRWQYLYFPSYYAPFYPPTYTPDMWPDRTYPLSEYDYMNYTFADNNGNICGDNCRFSKYADNGPGVASISRSNNRTGYSGRIRSHPSNYRRRPYTRTQDGSRIIGPIDSIEVDTNSYPTEESGFAGGYSSQRFINNMAYASGLTVGRGEMRGFGSPIDNTRSRGLNYADRKTAQSYTKGGGRKTPVKSTTTLSKSGRRSLSRLKHGNPTVEHFGTSDDITIPPNVAFVPVQKYVFDQPDHVELQVVAFNNLEPVIPFTDGLYQASDQWVTDSRANSQTVPTIPISAANPFDSTLNDLFAFARDKTTVTNIGSVIPYVDLSNNLFTQYIEHYQPIPDSDVNTDPYLKERDGNNVLENKNVFDYVNKYNMGPTRPIGSGRLGRGWGIVTGFDQRQEAYGAQSTFFTEADMSNNE